MFAIKPILWYDINKISQRSKRLLEEEYAGKALLIPVCGDGSRVVGSVLPQHYPTPDQLFRWKHKEKR